MRVKVKVRGEKLTFDNAEIDNCSSRSIDNRHNVWCSPDRTCRIGPERSSFCSVDVSSTQRNPSDWKEYSLCCATERLRAKDHGALPWICWTFVLAVESKREIDTLDEMTSDCRIAPSSRSSWSSVVELSSPTATNPNASDRSFRSTSSAPRLEASVRCEWSDLSEKFSRNFHEERVFTRKFVNRWVIIAGAVRSDRIRSTMCSGFGHGWFSLFLFRFQTRWKTFDLVLLHLLRTPRNVRIRCGRHQLRSRINWRLIR